LQNKVIYLFRIRYTVIVIQFGGNEHQFQLSNF